jgi:LysR family transcriptional regulator, low CO2-responsive transcriptional regulator
MSLLNLDLHQLIVFYNVANEQSIAIAADKLCLTQPTVSYHLKAMEKNAGVKLFNIKKQRVYLTGAGKDLYQFTKEIWVQLNNIDVYFTSLKQKPIKIGVTPLIHKQITAALSKIYQSHPDVNIEIVIANTNKIVRDVSDMEIDLGVVVSTIFEADRIKAVRISDNEKLVFVASPNMPIAKKEKVDWADLKDLPIVCGQQGSLLNNIVTEKFRIAGIQTSPNIVVKVNTLSTDVLKIFVKEGHAIGLWDIKDVQEEAVAGELRILPLAEEITVPIDYISNANIEFDKPVLKELLKNIKKELNTPPKLDLV